MESHLPHTVIWEEAKSSLHFRGFCTTPAATFVLIEEAAKALRGHTLCPVSTATGQGWDPELMFGSVERSSHFLAWKCCTYHF